MHPLGAGLFLALAAVFVICHGAGNGILTIAKGTLPLVLFDPQGYGQRQGILIVPARIAQALAPWVFGLSLDRWDDAALWLSGGLGMIAFGALMALGAPGGQTGVGAARRDGALRHRVGAHARTCETTGSGVG